MAISRAKSAVISTQCSNVLRVKTYNLTFHYSSRKTTIHSTTIHELLGMM